eukprot:4612883-Pyramimonas_sp.AAC.2
MSVMVKLARKSPPLGNGNADTNNTPPMSSYANEGVYKPKRAAKLYTTTKRSSVGPYTSV